jgi:type VI protein secretion system component VasF
VKRIALKFVKSLCIKFLSQDVDENNLHGTFVADAYLQDRHHYTELAKELGLALGRIMPRDELIDFRAELLVMLVRQRDVEAPAHAYALLIQLMTAIQDQIKKNNGS